MDRLISKQDFIALDPKSVKIQCVCYNKKLVGHTTYSVEVGIVTLNKYYLKSLRFRDLEALDTVLNEKFRNLKFPTLPSKQFLQ